MTRLIRSFTGALFVVISAAWLPAADPDWSPKMAAQYLDNRQQDWFAWPNAQIAGGPCVSCHTGLTYLLARPVLRKELGEAQPTQYETGLLSAMRARVDKRDAKGIFPGLTKEPHASEGVGVESILAALFLSPTENASADPAPAVALSRLWAVQIRDGKDKGGWHWFSLNADPYETESSGFFGSALALLAAERTPAAYRRQPEIKESIAAATSYLQNARDQPLHNRLMLLWLARSQPEILPAGARRQLMDEVFAKQSRDGGWTMDSLGPWIARPDAPSREGSSAYATAVAAVALEQAGIRASDPRLAKALDWLKAHQAEDGSWEAPSMNKRYPAGSMQEKFMRDAATAYASMALLGWTN